MHVKQTRPSGQDQCDMFFNHVISDFVKTRYLFHVISIELQRQTHI